MNKEYDFQETIHASIDQVWEALHQPSRITSEWNAKIREISNTEWEEVSNPQAPNRLKAVLNEAEHTLRIHGVNEQYDTETSDVLIRLEATDAETTEVHVHYNMGTTAIFNIIAMDLLGKQVVHHAGEVVLKNIRKLVKE